MIDWNDLRFALEIVRTGSLSGASRRLGVHQTTVGRRLGALEEQLGFPMFLRTASGLVPTSDGTRILARLEEVADSLVRFEQGARSREEDVSGLVRIAVTETTGRQLVEDAIPRLLEEHPKLAIELVPANTVTDLARGDADLAVRLLPPDESFVARRLGFVRHGLYASAGYLRDHGRDLGADLAKHRVVVPTRELAKGPEASWLDTHARAAARVFYGSSFSLLAHAAERGLGLAVLPTNLGRMHDGLMLVRKLDEIPGRPIWLVLHRDQRRVRRVRLVADRVAAELRHRLGS